jgi:adenosylcobinamide-phosphate synthase
MDHALIALLALVLNLVAGGPRSLYEASGLARFGRIPAKLLRDREPHFTQSGEPVLLVAYTLAMAVGLGLLLTFILAGLLQLLEIAIVAACLPLRSTLERVYGLLRGLETAQLPEARRMLEGTVWRHHVLLDAHGLSRAGIELLAMSLNERVLHPLLWYLLLGLPGLFACRACTLLRESLPVSFDVPRHLRQLLFRLPEAGLWLVSRLASLLWIAGSFLVPPPVAGVLARFTGEAARLNSVAYTLFTPAAVLGLALGGPTSAYHPQGWLGSGSAKATPAQLRRGLYIAVLVLVFMLLLLALAVA